uniref:Uncharacterized protein n=1 Tax=Globodera rostochiensis TaxID=31243 RepID=A0A914H6W5_GLORO
MVGKESTFLLSQLYNKHWRELNPLDTKISVCGAVDPPTTKSKARYGNLALYKLNEYGILNRTIVTACLVCRFANLFEHNSRFSFKFEKISSKSSKTADPSDLDGQIQQKQLPNNSDAHQRTLQFSLLWATFWAIITITKYTVCFHPKSGQHRTIWPTISVGNQIQTSLLHPIQGRIDYKSSAYYLSNPRLLFSAASLKRQSEPNLIIIRSIDIEQFGPTETDRKEAEKSDRNIIALATRRGAGFGGKH